MQIEEGTILNGKVTGLTNFGAFVSLEGGKTGMVHISEVANTYVKDIKEVLSEGQEVRVMVIGVTDGKISLSIKRIEAAEAPQKPERHQRDAGPSQPRPQQNGGRERRSAPPVWNGQKSQPASGNQSFEEMMSRFKQVSDEKMTDLKRAGDSKRGGGGYNRRGSNKQ